ncbi:MAG: phosphoribosylglycinamide formyltransferase [Lentisphaerae bacterium]|nr:phosphoribosylglycinamide formyltransferase [Lentisphaerota bacterium]
MKTKAPLSIAVLGSGQGSNFQAIADAIQEQSLVARIVCVLADNPAAFILERARRLGVPAEYIDPAPYKNKLAGAAELKTIERLRYYRAELIVLAGFMRIIKAHLLAAYPARIINIHPSLLPAFPGLHSWKQALDYGVKVSGCTVHFVDAGMDSGPIILQRTVPVLPDDTPETLHARIQEQEHQAYPEAIRQLIANYNSPDHKR